LFLSFYSGSLLTEIRTASLAPILSAGFLGIFCSAISYLVWAKLVSKYSISSLATSFYLIPVFTLFIAFVFLREMPSVLSLIGGVIALSGVGIASISERMVIPKNLEFIKHGYDLLLGKH
jgi:drug/metabolite transporter (DMT)-like permease